MIRVTVDTNILIYAVDVDAGSKHLLATHIVEVLSRHGCVLPLQALAEFYRATTKKRTFLAAEAKSLVLQFQRSMHIVPYIAEDLRIAMETHQQHGLQFFDALMVCTARRAGCHTLLTEDMQNDRKIDGITIRNPFLLSSSDLDQVLEISSEG